MLITPAQRNDIVEAEALIIGYDSEHVIGDKGYDSNDFIDVIEANGATAVKPSRSNRVDQRTYDRTLYEPSNRRSGLSYGNPDENFSKSVSIRAMNEKGLSVILNF